MPLEGIKLTDSSKPYITVVYYNMYYIMFYNNVLYEVRTQIWKFVITSSIQLQIDVGKAHVVCRRSIHAILSNVVSA